MQHLLQRQDEKGQSYHQDALLHTSLLVQQHQVPQGQCYALSQASRAQSQRPLYDRDLQRKREGLQHLLSVRRLLSNFQ
jgi:hypothetical protein